ncbi:MAG: PhzF family phenazine biosynthesis protein [Bacteroidales bacterium]|jgi:PhzF family phenazine biosynthesis protein|nr:PhzF family phenazine biosynthesis protein [Bacteroidales bacterium]
MKMKLFHVDSFTNTIFKGNPAAVCFLNKWLDDEIMSSIAVENNLAETAFCMVNEDGYHLRWFTPEYEIDLCGHATLATAHIIFTEIEPDSDRIEFESVSGTLTVTRDVNGKGYVMDFPSRMPVKSDLPDVILKGIGKDPVEVYKSRDYVLVYETEEDVVNINPDRELLNTINIDPGGVIVTAKGDDIDFVSRFFTPQASIFEDPVTGSAHCSLIPFWAERLGKQTMVAKQLSDREGMLYCENADDRVFIKGEAVTFFKGEIYL